MLNESRNHVMQRNLAKLGPVEKGSSSRVPRQILRK